MSETRFFVYILASASRVLYVGVTRDLQRRVFQHRQGLIKGFTTRYRVTRLVYYKDTPSARAAFEQEHQIKAWSREKKLRLIESVNAGWLDLAIDWFPESAE